MNGKRPYPAEDLFGVRDRARWFHRYPEHDEFVVVESRDNIACAPHRGRDRLTHLTEYVVGRHPPVYLDVGAERVEVEPHHRDPALVALGDRPVATQHLHQVLPGGEAAVARQAGKCLRAFERQLGDRTVEDNQAVPGES